ncbi:hypothetical protein GALL_431860 [mine drainage metagenome]|uniref:Uncharacterized protein n=1 Tax=mine drainage metagenome TaxID=410659 RepID=A0A1J5Q5H8_9ZZZZ
MGARLPHGRHAVLDRAVRRAQLRRRHGIHRPVGAAHVRDGNQHRHRTAHPRPRRGDRRRRGRRARLHLRVARAPCRGTPPTPADVGPAARDHLARDARDAAAEWARTWRGGARRQPDHFARRAAPPPGAASGGIRARARPSPRVPRDLDALALEGEQELLDPQRNPPAQGGGDRYRRTATHCVSTTRCSTSGPSCPTPVLPRS